MAVMTPNEADVREMAGNLVEFRGSLETDEQRQFDAIAVMAFDVQAPAPAPSAPSLDRLDGAVDSLNDAMARLAEKMASFEKQMAPAQQQLVEPVLVDACRDELSALMADLGNSVFGDNEDDVQGWMMSTGTHAWWRQPGAPDPAALLLESGWEPSVTRDEAEQIVRTAARAGLLTQIRTHRI